jgi:hypothetical protein
MKTNPPYILIAAAAGPLRSALKALLESIPRAEYTVLETEPAAFIETTLAFPPKVILLAGKEFDLEQNRLKKLRQHIPQVRIIYLLEDVQNAPGWHSSADFILQQGAPVEELLGAIEKCLE